MSSKGTTVLQERILTYMSKVISKYEKRLGYIIDIHIFKSKCYKNDRNQDLLLKMLLENKYLSSYHDTVYVLMCIHMLIPRK